MCIALRTVGSRHNARTRRERTLFAIICAAYLVTACRDARADNPPPPPIPPDCAIPLGGQLIEIDGLNDRNLICPVRDESSNGEPDCRTSDLQLERMPTASMGEAVVGSRLPDGILEAMFFDPEEYQLCSGIFKDGNGADGANQFQDAISKIQPASLSAIRSRWPYYSNSSLDQTQRAMATVFLALSSWNYCHYKASFDGQGVHARFLPSKGTITLFGSACEAAVLYGTSLKKLNVGHRYYLIAGHELGHAIAHAAGDDSSGDHEGRATTYGIYVAECFSRSFQRQLARLASPEESPLVRPYRECQIQAWKDLERHLSEIRKGLTPADSNSAKSTRDAMDCRE